MKILPPLSLLLSLAGWALIALTTANLLSGPFEGRSCQTDCVQGYFFSAVGIGLAGLASALFTLWKPGGNAWGYLSLLISIPLCLIVGFLFLVGNI